MTGLRPIRSKRAYEQALARIDELMDATLGSPEADELDVLADLVELYERKHHSLGELDPVTAIRIRMEERGLSASDLVPAIGSRSRVSDVLAGRRAITLPMARALHRYLEIPAEVLLREPRPPEGSEVIDWRKFPIHAMANRGWLPLGLPSHAKELMEGLCERAGATGKLSALFRQTRLRANIKDDRYALQAWCWQAMARARSELPRQEFVPGTITLDVLREVAGLSRYADGPVRAKAFLASLGVPLVTLGHLRRTYLDGAALQLADGRPVVALTLRYDRLDNFWFCLLHELAHVGRHMNHNDPQTFVDDLSLRQPGSPAEDVRETEADEWAEEASIPGDAWMSSEVHRSPKPMNVIHFANELGIHQAIVAGRVRFERNNYRLLSQFVGRGEVRRQFEPTD